MISTHALGKQFDTPAGAFSALSDVTLEIAAGEFVAVMGDSGSGKSTLLNLLAGVERPTRGSLSVDGVALQNMTERELTVWRGATVGIVFQSFQLLPTLSAMENVLLAMDFCERWPMAERQPRAESLLDRVGVADQRDKRPATLSGGQQQRVAIARALANAPRVLLADEPTGNLDSRTAEQMLGLFASLATDGHAVVMVTHADSVQRHASRTVRLRDGRIVDDRHA